MISRLGRTFFVDFMPSDFGSQVQRSFVVGSEGWVRAFFILGWVCFFFIVRLIDDSDSTQKSNQYQSNSANDRIDGNDIDDVVDAATAREVKGRLL